MEPLVAGDLDLIAFALDHNFVGHRAINLDEAIAIEGRAEQALHVRENPRHRGAHLLAAQFHQGEAIRLPFDQRIEEIEDDGFETMFSHSESAPLRCSTGPAG